MEKMTRFMRDLNGEFGPYWKEQAEKELETTRAALKHGNIIIGITGVGRNCIGRALSDDVLEKVAMVSDEIDIQATRQAYVSAPFQNVVFRRNGMSFFTGRHAGVIQPYTPHHLPA